VPEFHFVGGASSRNFWAECKSTFVGRPAGNWALDVALLHMSWNCAVSDGPECKLLFTAEHADGNCCLRAVAGALDRK